MQVCFFCIGFELLFKIVWATEFRTTRLLMSAAVSTGLALNVRWSVRGIYTAVLLGTGSGVAFLIIL